MLGTASERNHDFVRSLGGQPASYGDDLHDLVAELVGGDGKVDVVADFVPMPSSWAGSPSWPRRAG